jgi:hypothetical protein
MKADKALIIRAAELGILRSMESFLVKPLKPGRLKTRFEFIKMIVDSELSIIRTHDKYFFVDNKKDITIYLQTLSDALNWIDGETHIGSVVSFCLTFLERSKSVYDKKLNEYLFDILDYYERKDNITYKDIYNGREFDNNWKIISEMMDQEESKDKECPKCGGGPLYQDRLESIMGEAHCDDCGEVFSKEEYLKIIKGEN